MLKYRLSPIAYSEQQLVFFESGPVSLCWPLLMQWTAVEGESDSSLSKDRVTKFSRWTSRTPDQTQVLMNEPNGRFPTTLAVDLATTEIITLYGVLESRKNTLQSV